MTLLKFLEARLAEDETVAQYDLGEAAAYDALTGNDHAGRRARRALAEVAAKRAIVAAIVAVDDGQAHPWTLILGDVVLSNLAAVYSDHPDYDESW